MDLTTMILTTLLVSSGSTSNTAPEVTYLYSSTSGGIWQVEAAADRFALLRAPFESIWDGETATLRRLEIPAFEPPAFACELPAKTLYPDRILYPVLASQSSHAWLTQDGQGWLPAPPSPRTCVAPLFSDGAGHLLFAGDAKYVENAAAAVATVYRIDYDGSDKPETMAPLPSELEHARLVAASSEAAVVQASDKATGMPRVCLVRFSDDGIGCTPATARHDGIYLAGGKFVIPAIAGTSAVLLFPDTASLSFTSSNVTSLPYQGRLLRGNPQHHAMGVKLGNRVIFLGFGVAAGTMQMWSSDGTATGTHPVGPSFPSATDQSVVAATRHGGRALFPIPDGLEGWRHFQVWVTDGTAKGTERLMAQTDSGDLIPVAFSQGLQNALYMMSDGELLHLPGYTDGYQGFELRALRFVDAGQSWRLTTIGSIPPLRDHSGYVVPGQYQPHGEVAGKYLGVVSGNFGPVRVFALRPRIFQGNFEPSP